jgi:quercetin dioxygenase-like cupin family protein
MAGDNNNVRGPDVPDTTSPAPPGRSRKRSGRRAEGIPSRGLRWGMAVAVAGVLAAAGVAMGTAQAQTPPQPIAVELLTQRAVFTDDVELQIRNKLDGHATDVSNSRDPSRTVVAKITVQPGAQFPWHTHPGPVIVNVAEGELTYIMAHDCVERPYAAGSAFVDPGRGMTHTAVNRTDDVTVLLATFFEVPETGALTIPVQVPVGCTP